MGVAIIKQVFNSKNYFKTKFWLQGLCGKYLK